MPSASSSSSSSATPRQRCGGMLVGRPGRYVLHRLPWPTCVRQRGAATAHGGASLPRRYLGKLPPLCLEREPGGRFPTLPHDHQSKTGGLMTPRTTVGLLALALALPLPVFAQAGGDLRAQIGKMDQAWDKAYNAGDAAAVTALYTKDAKILAPGAEPVSGTAAIQAFFTADIAQ